MAELPPGRALWEGGGSIDAYGTPLALMLLPYWTHGRIQSFEGLYYESAASTPYVFMAIAPLSASGNASNPVRGLDYLSIANFSDGVRYLRALGGRYYLAHSQAAKDAANRDPGLRLVGTSPDVDHQAPEGWSIYEVRDHALVAPLQYEPVVVAPHAGTQRACFGGPGRDRPGARARRLGVRRGRVVVEAGEPRPTARRVRARVVAAADGQRAAAMAPAPAARRCAVTDVHQTDNDIRFHVSRTGVPGGGAHLVLPELGGARRARSVAAQPEPDGGRADEPRRLAALRPLGRREGRRGGQRGGPGGPRRARDLRRAAAPAGPADGGNPRQSPRSEPVERPGPGAGPGATMTVPPRGR